MDQDVKGIVENARLGGAEVLQKIEIRPTVGAKRYQLSVDHRIFGQTPSMPLRCRETSG